MENKIRHILDLLYGEKAGEKMTGKVIQLINKHKIYVTGKITHWDEKDVILITYPDNILDCQGKRPLVSLKYFLRKYLPDTFNTIHILPFFAYSSDQGFSVSNYRKVKNEFGNWADVRNLQADHSLMIDLVINHSSIRHPWFIHFLENKKPGKNYYTLRDSFKDVSKVVRPRATPLFTSFQTISGKKEVWTTFGPDQPDLNFSNPGVLMEMIKILVFYLSKGARMIRIDAIAYLWKKDGTACINLPETHQVVKLLRAVAESVNPCAIIITETNLPHEENMSYVRPADEAHMAYQFSLPPLLLYSLHTGNAEYLAGYLKTLPDPGPGSTYLNFTASHDGIGLRPLEGILPEQEIELLVGNMIRSGGLVSNRRSTDGMESPYELNISYFDAMKMPRKGEDDFQAARFLSSQIIMLGLKGIPALYILSLMATGNDHRQLEKSGEKRDINRKKWNCGELMEILEAGNVQSMVFHELKRVIVIRKSQPVFHPGASQEILEAGSDVLAFARSDRNNKLLCLHNLTGRKTVIDPGHAGLEHGKEYHDLLSGKSMIADQALTLQPYQNLWIKHQQDA